MRANPRRRPIPRAFVSLACGVMTLVLCARPVAADEGRYRGPLGAIPRSARPPGDLPPPPPPPPGGGQAPEREARPEDWSFFLWHRREILLDPLGPPPAPLAPESLRRGLEVLRRTASDAGVGPNAGRIRSAALRALARASNAPEDIELLLATLAPDPADGLPPESMLALGLLRRSDPAQRMLPDLLGRVRQALVMKVQAESPSPDRRLYAALAIGLLADQGASADLLESVLMPLASLLKHPDDGLARAALLVIGMHPPMRGSAGIARDLRALAFRSAGGVRAAQALTTLASWSDQALDPTLGNLLKMGKVEARIQRAVALGLAIPAPHLSAQALVRRIEELQAAADRDIDDTARDYALLGSYRQALLQDASADDGSHVRSWMNHAKAAPMLPRTQSGRALSGRPRRYACASWLLGLWARRQVGSMHQTIQAKGRALAEQTPGWAAGMWTPAEYRAEVAQLTKSNRGGMGPGGGELVLSLAIAVDSDSEGRSLVVSAAMADLDASPSTFETSIRLLSLIGLGLARLPALNDMLVRRLAKGNPDPLLPEIGVALGRTATDSALGRIVDLLDDPKASDWARLLACGVIGARLDPERVASLSLLLERLDYRDGTPWVRDLYGML